MPRNAQIKDNTGWYDYARSWLNYAQQVPSDGQSLDYGTINAAIDAYNAAAATDPGTPEFNAKWQTATDAINTMVTVNDWHYAPAAPSGPAATPTLATVNVAPTPDELAQAGIAPGNPGSGSTYGPLDDLRGLGNAAASGVADVDRGIARFNGAVNAELVDQGAQDLRNGNQAGFIWNGIKYSFYNTFMPNNVEGAAVNLAGGAVAGKVVGLVAKGATVLWPVLGRGAGDLASEGLSGNATRSYGSFSAFKRAEGPAGPGMQWHHIVEQTSGNVNRFGPESIHNTDNLVRLDTMTHRQVSALYSSKPAGSDVTVRQSLGQKSFQEQYDFGHQVLRNFGIEK